jgi:serine/threonine-protein kinase RsbW
MSGTFLLKDKIPTDLNRVNSFVEEIAKKILSLAGSEEEAFKVKLALEEALTNAMRHGNSLEAEKLVNVRIEASKEKIVVDVHDEGKGFDFRVLPDPTDKDYSDRPSGRGIFLMRKLMDTVEFYDAGSGVKMTKLFSS